MRNKNTKSIEMIRLIAHALGELNKKAVYVGGASVPFYLPIQFLYLSIFT
jgi:hypothetical protein